jgi:hypothetical protein
MKETHKKEINGYTYAVTQMGALRARRVITRFLQVAGGALAAISAAGGKAGRKEAVMAVVENISDENMEFFYREFAADTVVSIPDPGRPDREARLSYDAAFDDVFVNRYADMIEWLLFAFEVNFGNFLLGGGDLMKKLAARFDTKAAATSDSAPPKA